MKSIIILVLSVFVLALFGGCQSRPQSREATSYLFQANNNVYQSMEQMKSKFEEWGYSIRSYDPTIGIITTNPVEGSETSVSNGFKYVIQIRQEGGSLKIRIEYQCKYQLSEFEDCVINDPGTMDAIQNVDTKIYNLVNKLVSS